MHENTYNQKKYIGITNNRSPDERWQHGHGYMYNTKFYTDIKKYGWNNFNHKILHQNLTYPEARKLETEYIRKLDTVENGYNNIYSDCHENNVDFNYYDFKIINQPSIEYHIDNDYFIRVPNHFIKKDLGTEYGLNRIFLVVWIIIDRHRTLEDKSYITLGEILDLCGYKKTKRKPKIAREIIKCLIFLETNNYIDLDFFDIFNVPYERCISMKIIREIFDPLKNFTKIYIKEIDSILYSNLIRKENSNIGICRENILIVFLYIKSYIGERNESSTYDNSYNNPLAFWKSTLQMAKDLAMSRQTITDCIDYLTMATNTNKPLLIKHETGYIPQEKNKPPKQAPNICVLNKEGYEKEIQWALNKMMEIYKVDHFIKK